MIQWNTWMQQATTRCALASRSHEILPCGFVFCSPCLEMSSSNSPSMRALLCVSHLQDTLDINGGTCLPSWTGNGLTEQACSELSSPSSWNAGTCSDSSATTRAACDTAGGVWSVPVTTETFKYGVSHAFQAVSTNCDMVATPYLNSLCSQCSHSCMFQRSMKLQTDFAVASAMLIVTYLMALCAAGYNERLLAAEEKTLQMLARAKRCQWAVVLLSAIAVVLILFAHAKITKTCGLVTSADGDVRRHWIFCTQYS